METTQTAPGSFTPGQMKEIAPNGLVSMDQLSQEQLETKLREWRRDPVLYCIERLGINCRLEPGYFEGDQMDAHQKMLLRELPKAIVTRKRVVVSSANAMGKDYIVSGRATLWFYECFGPECKVVMTGPGERQVEEIMWNELKSAYEKRPSEDGFGRLLTCYLDGGPDHFITAFTTKDTGKAKGKFQGIHSSRLMVIVSEAQAVDDTIFEQIEGSTMAEILIVVYLGNPLITSGAFARAIEDTANNTVIVLDAYDSINVKSGLQKIPGIVSAKWVAEKEKAWNHDGSGKDPRYQARVRGKLPTSAINAIISRELYDRCIHRELTWWSTLYGTVGVDPALTGTDDMVISIFKSGKLVGEEIIPYNENEAVAAGKIQIQVNSYFPTGGCVVVIDSDGLGIKVKKEYDKMVPNNVLNPITVVEYRGSCNDRAIVDKDYANIRAQAHFYAKQRMMDGHISLNDCLLSREEATACLYFTNNRGHLQVEDKDDLKTRIARSPNRWDARVCGIWGFRTAQKIRVKDAWADDSNGRSIGSGVSGMSA